MTLTVTGTGLGAQITGVDPNDLSNITRDEIREIVYANKLVILKGVHPSPEQYLQLGRIIGDIVPYYESMYHHHEFPEIFVSSTEEHQGVPRTGAFWHIDYMFMPEPFAFSMVLPLTVPGPDRGTYFIDLNQAWASVPAALQDAARGTWSTHDPRRHIKIRPDDVYRPIGEVWDEITRTTPPIKWPTVIRHPKTGEEILYICASGTTKIEDQESRALEPSVLQELMAATGQLDPAFTHPFIHTQHYEVGDIILWDNRVLMHRAKHGSSAGTLTTYRLTMLDGLETPGYPA
ncbi:TauD/TfdA family dioxygenase [Mycolicibacter heraklionensis]|uniref:(3R)-3-[(carboxymethyl)amino]fatty acid oxygenase/decarboxylase n=1 Tax=Mycolicibacter heraklionensis TaxID=512402 RepID=UPI0007EB5235|nr:TauD/TfdA family dioxygenase [Mycolicibacter heraklionensis]OBG38397.1 taurine catabolism dioxygenase [Mycolicibacter heraklionensis]